MIATARRPEVLAGLIEMGMTGLQLDVTSAASIAACLAAVTKLTGGRLDYLVNNAGCRHVIPATDMNLDDVRRTYETNVFGVFAMVSQFAPLLVAGQGQIVFMSSMASITPYVWGSIFCSTKGAINSYARTLRSEMKPFGVHVLVAMTGSVESTMDTGNSGREIPNGSLWESVRDLFVWRVKFSQSQGKNTVSTAEFAKGLVQSSMKGRGWLGGLVGGTPDVYWGGGHAQAIWWASLFGDALLTPLVERKMRLGELTKRLAGTKQKLIAGAGN